jgi:hypothetical protein
MTRMLCSLLIPALLVLASGCSSTRFQREWKKTALAPAPDNAIEGRWEGRWLSHKNQHTGHLRCVVSQTHGKNYRFQFWATYWKVFRFAYTVPFRVEEADSGFGFAGQEDLGGYAGGVYHYEGTIRNGQFSATYSNRFDHGIFEMKRIE